MDVIVEEGGEEGGEDDEGLTDEYRSGLKEEDGKEGVEEGATPAHYQVNHLLHDILPLCYEKEKTDAFILQIAPFVKRKGVAKRKTVKYVGELVKFKICPPIVPFTFLNACLEAFSRHNVELACALLESCGRFLFLTPHTHTRLKGYLSTMERLKRVKSLDPTLEVLIDNACLICNPPSQRTTTRQTVLLPPLYAYLRFLLFERLSPKNTDDVLYSLRKFPWKTPRGGAPAEATGLSELEVFFLRSVLQAARGKFHALHALADVVAGLGKYHENMAVSMVDEVLEELKRGLETAGGRRDRDTQGFLALSRLLGEFYNYNLIPHALVFDTLYLFLHYGHEVPPHPSLPSSIPPSFPPYVTHDPRILTPLDPPADTFRCHLVINLLQACGPLLAGKGHEKVRGKLSLFLTYFQRYLFCRGYV
ncbi:regulator of nonsense transcripts 2, partial [Nannochloropsis gaditana CCMP526]|uniref:regulator of nonsense transcripts 2 n=1 Tax=Nannochloropsis gaditana (strain CCMP526) TaxID=1093141 RepID=UPI00029F6966